jgi:agmatine/peptidylarginine deiminase
VRKISAYSCTGTGGHIESAALYYAGEVIATASWHGYQDEYHTLSFSNEVVLDEGTEYQYEIVTGSYPMAIHQQENTTLDGSFINCTSFIDVNGNVHASWIPSFWLGP